VTGDPEMGVLYAECEEMCYFFAHLCDDQFGEFPDTGSGISRESRSNLVAWSVIQNSVIRDNPVYGGASEEIWRHAAVGN
jgi:hypothetical protein